MLLGFGVAFVVAEYVALLESNLARARSSVASQALAQSARLAGLAGKASLPGNKALLDTELGYLEEDTELKYAFICVVHTLHMDMASPREWSLRALSSTGAADAEDIIKLTNSTGTSQTKVISNRDMLVTAYPVARFAGSPDAQVAVVARDLSNPFWGAREDARSDVLTSSLVLLALCGVLGWVLHLLVGKRARQVLSTGQSILHHQRVEAPLSGGDEFADISSVFQAVNQKLLSQDRLLHLHSDRYRKILEMLPALVFINRADHIEYINGPGLRLLGAKSAEDILGKSPYDLLHADSQPLLRERLRSANGSGEVLQPVEQQIVRMDGTLLTVEVVSSTFHDHKGEAQQVIMWDVSERMASEAKREALSRDLEEKNRELETIVFVASHDLRSPLVNVMGFSRQLSGACRQLENLVDRSNGSIVATDAEPIVKGTVPRALKFIEQGVTKMDALLSGFLRFSRLGRAVVEFQRLDMNALIRSILGAMNYQIQQAGADIRVGELPGCLGDPTQINQVFTNLIDNGIKYRQPGRPSIVSVQGRIENNVAVYTVTDNGLGIPRDHLGKIFQIFHRLNPSESAGEGLGLTIAQRILERHGGGITVQSQPGEGSTFIVTLPITQPI